jgi:uncharacterized protein YhaN
MKKDYVEENQKDLEIMAKHIMEIEKRLQKGEISQQQATYEMEDWFKGIPLYNLVEVFEFLDDYILKNLDK